MAAFFRILVAATLIAGGALLVRTAPRAQTRGENASPETRSHAARTTGSARRGPLHFSPRNLLLNPTFEEGREPWWSFAGPERPYWADFDVATDRAHSGHRAARLSLTSREYQGKERIYGVIQEVAPGELPRRLSGWYRVEDWRRGAKNQYLQVVVIVWGPKNVGGGATNIQVSYVLGGITKPPFSISNRRFLFLGPEEPETGKWLRFDRDLRADFEAEYGAVPEGFEKIRVLYEVRYDGRSSGDPEAGAVVYYDDLYLGP